MNIFATSDCPVESARALDDKRVVKMSLESAQMASTVLRFHCGVLDQRIYRSTHVRHPCVLWAAEHGGNFRWLCEHGLALLDEADWRWGAKDRKCRPILLRCLEYADFMPKGVVCEFQNSARLSEDVMDFTDVSPVTEAYRQYLSAKWRSSEPTFTRRSPPNWFLP